MLTEVTFKCVCVFMFMTKSYYIFLQVVFRGGEGSLQVLPPLIDVIPEARLNLVIYYLKQGQFAFFAEVFSH